MYIYMYVYLYIHTLYIYIYNYIYIYIYIYIFVVPTPQKAHNTKRLSTKTGPAERGGRKSRCAVADWYLPIQSPI